VKLLTADMKLAEIVHSNYLLIPVLNRFGIRLGFGEKTVRTVCRERRINLEFFLAIVNAFSNEDFFPEARLRTVNVLTIVDYLRTTHAYYIHAQIPRIERLLRSLARSKSRRTKGVVLAQRFFQEYKRELLAHLKREEDVTFPYVEQVYRLHRSRRSRGSKDLLARYSMQAYEEEHDNVDEKLDDLKNILIKYVSSGPDDDTLNTVIFELFRLERDIIDHTRIEDTILRPIVAEMEQAIQRTAR